MLTEVRKRSWSARRSVGSGATATRRSPCSPTAAPARASARRAARSSSAASTAARRRSTAAATSTPSGITLNDAGDPHGTFLPTRRRPRPLHRARDARWSTTASATTSSSRSTTRRSRIGKLKPRGDAKPSSATSSRSPAKRREPRRPRPAGPLRPASRADRRTTSARPDILSLEEIQDNDGAASAAPTAADVTFNTPAGGDQGGRRPDLRLTARSTRTPTQDGGEPNGNIRVAFLFRTDRATCSSSTGRVGRRPSATERRRDPAAARS